MPLAEKEQIGVEFAAVGKEALFSIFGSGHQTYTRSERNMV
jgi:hypothetical protein